MEDSVYVPEPIRAYRTPDGKVLVFDGPLVALSINGQDFFEVGTSSNKDNKTYMHVHVPGLNILVAELRKVRDTDTYRLAGIDALFPGLSQQTFVRINRFTYDGIDHRLPGFVPTTAFMAKLPDDDGSDYILAIRELHTKEWSIFFLNDEFFGGLTYVPQIGSRGIATIAFAVDGHKYTLENSPFSNGGPRHTRDGQPMQPIDPEEYRIEVVWTNPSMAYVRLTPLAHAQL